MHGFVSELTMLRYALRIPHWRLQNTKERNDDVPERKTSGVVSAGTRAWRARTMLPMQ